MFQESYGDQLEYGNESCDPLEVERNRPRTADIPGIHVVEDWEYLWVKRCHVQVSITYYDDVGLDRAVIEVTDNGNRKTTLECTPPSGYVK